MSLALCLAHCPAQGDLMLIRSRQVRWFLHLYQWSVVTTQSVLHIRKFHSRPWVEIRADETPRGKRPHVFPNSGGHGQVHACPGASSVSRGRHTGVNKHETQLLAIRIVSGRTCNVLSGSGDVCACTYGTAADEDASGASCANTCSVCMD